MSLSISPAASTQPASTPAPAPAPTTQPVQPQITTDTVTLSQSAQVIQLNQQGQLPQEIASSLGISLSTVDSDLGIAASTTS
jgi:hypothetical protein